MCVNERENHLMTIWQHNSTLFCQLNHLMRTKTCFKERLQSDEQFLMLYLALHTSRVQEMQQYFPLFFPITFNIKLIKNPVEVTKKNLLLFFLQLQTVGLFKNTLRLAC